MSDDFGQYSFLPWLRRGIANQLEPPAGTSSRAQVSVELHLRSDAGATGVATRKLLLVGPGDIVGINPQMVLRTEPLAGITNFEPNYLAYVDFYDEDFVWRYSPERPDTAHHRLRPWITLLVLTEGEFRIAPGHPLPRVELASGIDVKHVLPPLTEIWAWAHVHVNAKVDGPAPNLDVLGTLLKQNPDAAYARLLSPRRLKENTPYTAFVIPTFEVGCRAGFGETVSDSADGTAISWSSLRSFPIYFQWSFATGAAGDFEDLVRALVPRDVDERVGIRELDIQQPGFHVPPTTGQPDNIVGLEGALRAPTMKPREVEDGCNLPNNLEAAVNLAADVQTTGPSGDPSEDPLVTVPLYGRWHALVDRVRTFKEDDHWINELNTDPRFRAVAGMGTKVIQDNQESYMQLAWEQIGDVLSVNRKISLLQLSVKATERLYLRDLTPLAPERALAITHRVSSKVLGSPVTVHALIEQSRLPAAALSGAMRKQLRPRGLLVRRTFDRSMRAQALAHAIAGLNSGDLTAAPPPRPPEGVTYEGSLDAVAPKYPAWLRWLALHRELFLLVAIILLLLLLLIAASPATLAVVAIAAALVAAAYRRLGEIADQIRTVDGFQPSALTPDSIAALPPNDAFVLPDPDLPFQPLQPTGGPDSPQGAAFRQAAIDFNAAFVSHAVDAARPEPLRLPAAHTSMMRALRPGPAFMGRYGNVMTVGDRFLPQYIGAYHDLPPAVPPPGDEPVDPRIVPVMAYPDIKLPMYRPLKELQKDNFVPNLHLVLPDTISLMLTNPPVIEAYMVGLNHEFARELLWREYPTDQRPSTFRQFWDPSNYVDTEQLTPEQLAEKVRDIRRVHEWPLDSKLGEHNNRLPNDDKPRVVLVIRGELLKRYPNTIIYAQRAVWGQPPIHENDLSLYDEHGATLVANSKDPHFRFPMFRAQVEPDIYFIGFDLTLEEAQGDPTLEETAEARGRISPDKLGWFFVLQEVVGEPRFGLDEHKGTGSEGMVWDNLSWEHLAAGGRPPVIALTTPFTSAPLGDDGDGGATWGSHAADMGFILYQEPVLVGIHARHMLKDLKAPKAPTE